MKNGKGCECDNITVEIATHLGDEAKQLLLKVRRTESTIRLERQLYCQSTRKVTQKDAVTTEEYAYYVHQQQSIRSYLKKD